MKNSNKIVVCWVSFCLKSIVPLKRCERTAGLCKPNDFLNATILYYFWLVLINLYQRFLKRQSLEWISTDQFNYKWPITITTITYQLNMFQNAKAWIGHKEVPASLRVSTPCIEYLHSIFSIVLFEFAALKSCCILLCSANAFYRLHNTAIFRVVCNFVGFIITLQQRNCRLQI